ncbi:hypothetical protein [Streptomyces albiflavescens]|uniref:hypothetical protein n=1 Tax=Streptomyces albiflavescens TaxID=1623582 RepID=UPI001663D16B|nr:hypothetical protein [Streptomyces albiflavescens]
MSKPVVEAEHRRRVISLAALSRYCGRRMESTVEALAGRLAKAEKVKKRVSRVEWLCGIVLVGGPVVWLAVMTALSLAHGMPRGGRATLLYVLAPGTAFIGGAGAWLALHRACQYWFRLIGDYRAFVECVDVLASCGFLIRHPGSSRWMNVLVADICTALSEFTSEKEAFPVEAQRDQVRRHVSAVQQELISVAGGLFREGPPGVTRLVVTVSALVDRLVAERWLSLLDLDGTHGEAEGFAFQATERGRDGWIVIGGSATAALGLATAVSLGVPIAAAVPGALVLLLGPAMVWGGRQWRPSPQRLMTLVQDSMSRSSGSIEPVQTELAQPPR